MSLLSPPAGFIKLMILSFGDQNYTQINGAPYFALTNPQGYQISHKVEHSDNNQPQGQIPPPMLYVKTLPETLNFDFLFDTTGAIVSLNPSSLVLPLDKQINDFLDLTYNWSGSTHQTPFLKIIWGPTVFKGKFTDITVNYKMFDSSGVPIRAILNCTFAKSSASSAISDAFQALSSPDLTHSRVVQAGDTLPLLCNEIYQNSSYYLQVAQVNNLANFRNLQVGSTIYFPPLA